MSEYKHEEGTWILTSPSGKEYLGLSPMLALREEQSARIPADVALNRIYAAIAPTLEDKAELDAHMMEVESFAIAFAFYEGRQNGGTKYLVDGMRKAVRASALKLMGLSDE